jgi:hypothetical protein
MWMETTQLQYRQVPLRPLLLLPRRLLLLLLLLWCQPRLGPPLSLWFLLLLAIP